MSSAVAKLDAVLLAVALVGITFVCLLIFNHGNTLASLVPLATIILGFSFIFGHSAQTLFESVRKQTPLHYIYLTMATQLIFIFSTHVFDVGDLVMIDDQARPCFICLSCPSFMSTLGPFCEGIWSVLHDISSS